MILQCNRGSSPACLDWSEICNGQINCADREIDEEHCWQLELNECNDDEYRCTNGQSISRSFVRDYTRTSDCIDGSDEVRINSEQQNKFKTLSPSFEVDDRTCSFSFLTSSCVGTRNDLLLEAMYSKNEMKLNVSYGHAIIFTLVAMVYGTVPQVKMKPNGNLSPMVNCSSNDHICVSPDTKQLICLSTTKVNYGKINCLRATDETTLCHIKYNVDVYYTFYYRNTTSSLCLGSGSLCNDRNDCKYVDDEPFCLKNRTQTTSETCICQPGYASLSSYLEKCVCHQTPPQLKQHITYFSPDPINYVTDSSLPTIEVSHRYQPRWHRCVDLRVWLDDEKI
ncbi:unnamed protein product [Rotaria socialis]|uniref:Uncharacterized protein n=2 Tax=Rotaria socialis TaxID=392032 RepID=A0A820EI30_9BILA|nr:unnamed protein product [Rotaria socialis]CAF4247395.1 unnamed protein product [Rotaria socialis]